MSRVQLALNVSDLDAAVEFYSKLFNTPVNKRKPGYANFAIAEPPLKLVLFQGEAGEKTRMDHLGVEVFSSEEVAVATERLKAVGLDTLEQNDTTCCYARQDKVWATGPGQERWEFYVVKEDSQTFGEIDPALAAQATAAPATPADGCC